MIGAILVSEGGIKHLACDYDGKNLFPGDSFLTEQCSEVTCSEDFQARELGCASSVDESGCRLQPDFSLKYPGDFSLIE